MKVIIDIPDHLYKLLKDLPSDSNEGTIENVLMKAVENGTPLEDIKAEIADYTLSDDEKTDMDEDSIKWGIKIAYDIIGKIDKHTKGDADA